jgi:hypothetical protein
MKNVGTLLIRNIIVNILGGATPGGFNLMFPAEIADQGMLSRLVIVCTKPRSNKVPWPVATSPELATRIVEGYKALRQLSGAMTFAPDAAKLVEDIYRAWQGFADPRFDG